MHTSTHTIKTIGHHCGKTNPHISSSLPHLPRTRAVIRSLTGSGVRVNGVLGSRCLGNVDIVDTSSASCGVSVWRGETPERLSNLLGNDEKRKRVAPFGSTPVFATGSVNFTVKTENAFFFIYTADFRDMSVKTYGVTAIVPHFRDNFIWF